MFEQNKNAKEENGETSNWTFGLLLVGFLLIIIGVVVLVAATVLAGGSGLSSVGGVIFVGPIPIVFGGGLDAEWLILVSVIIAIVTLALVIVYRRSGRIGF